MFPASCDLPGSVRSSRVCRSHLGGMTLDDRETSWITDQPLAGSRCLSEWPPPTTNHVTSNVSKKKSRQNEGTDKTKSRQNENKDHCCPFSGTPRCFSAFHCQPQTENSDTERASAFSHLAAEAYKRSRLRTATARRWGTTWWLWFHAWKLPGIPAGETVSSKRACFHDTGCLAHSKPPRLFLHHGTWYEGSSQPLEMGHMSQRMGYTLHSTGSLTKIRLNQHMVNPSGTKAGLIPPKIRDERGSEQRRYGLLFPLLLYPQRFGILA